MICLGLLINITFGFASLGEINPIPQTRQLTPCHFSVMKSPIRLCTHRPDLGLLMAQSVPDRAVTPGGRQWPYKQLSGKVPLSMGILINVMDF